MRLLYLGTGEFGVPALRALVAHGYPVVAAVSQPDRPAGRGMNVTPTPIRRAADELRVPHVQAADVNALAPAELVRDAELGVVIAFGQKIGPAILQALPRGCVNLHASLLPKYRGAAPIQRAILAGERETGVTLFQLDERWDAGPIWAARRTEISETETADELHDRLSVLAADLLIDTLPRLASGEAPPQPQDPSMATRAPKLTREEGRVDWREPAARVARRIHGLWSWPAATCRFVSTSRADERVQLARARAIDDGALPDADHPPGTILGDLSVQTGRGRVQILEIKPAGGRLMNFDAFARGRHIRPGDRFLPLEGV